MAVDAALASCKCPSSSRHPSSVLFSMVRNLFTREEMLNEACIEVMNKPNYLMSAFHLHPILPK